MYIHKVFLLNKQFNYFSAAYFKKHQAENGNVQQN
jgi:hypothetical protein